LVAAEALAPLTFGEGFRVGVVGDTRCGKTEALKRLIEEYQRRSPGPVFIADTKERMPQFAGQYRRDKADLERHPPDPAVGRVIVFRGDHADVAGGEFDPEQIAEIQHELATRYRMPSLGVYDELDLACEWGQLRAKPSTIRWCFKQGGSSGVSVLWGTQETVDIPAPIFNQSSMILSFRMVGAPVRLLGKRGYLEGGAAETIETLPGEELPPAQRGYFVALRRGRPWDGKTSRFR
jgi:hypothetical protein